MSAVTILKTDMPKGNLVYGSNGPCAFFFAMVAMSHARFFFFIFVFFSAMAFFQINSLIFIYLPANFIYI